jgi:hypothetical protein
MTAKIHRKFLLAAAAATVALAALAPASPAASAEYEFEAGSVFAKGHAPLTPAPPFNFGGQGIFFVAEEYETWAQEIAEAPEATQAGGHPDFTTSFKFQSSEVEGYGFPAETTKDLVVDTPAGAVGNPLSVPRCESADFFLSFLGNCPTASQVGVSAVNVSFQYLVPVYSLVPPAGKSAMIAFKTTAITVSLFPEVRSEGDYGLRVGAREIFPGLKLIGTTLTLWGVPHDAIHDVHRIDRSTGQWGGSVPGTPRIFLSAPTDCETGPVPIPVRARSWEQPERWIEESDTAPEATGCEAIEFNPSLSAHPTTNVADSPTGLDVDLAVPQSDECEEGPPVQCPLATSHLRDTTVTLPPGLAINPSGANGLDGCSPSEAGLTTSLDARPLHFSADAGHCPDASAIAEVEVETPLLEAPMPGRVYIADPYDNPFHSLLALYIVIDDAERGIDAKLAGEVEADPMTGQLKTTFAENPQLPFSHFRLRFKQGPHAPLRTPGCGSYATTAELTPYSAPASPVDRQEDWSISQGPGGGCAVPNSPSLDAGSASPLAGASTPTVVNLSRADGTQEFSTVSLTLPPGLTGKLAGVGQCPGSALAAAEAKSGHEEEASPSCPASSRIGSAYVAAGAGPSPYNTTASAYLAGPYKGAPLSMAIVAPATAGPFDLGTVVVRVALYLDQNTGQITATSDGIPHILKGIPLDIRSTRIVLDRPGFTRNGTGCDPSAFSGQEISTLSQAAPLSKRFQLAECSSLSFKPKLGIRLFGGTKRGGHPALRGVVRMPEGGANVAQASVALPHSEFLDQGHIGTVCTRVQFAEGDGNGSACPPGSIYGHAVATSPLVDYPVEGPAILRSSSHELPDLVVALHGPPSQPVELDVAGRIDSIHGGIRTTFEGVPDLPVSSFVLSMAGGKKGLLENSTDICQGSPRATAVFDGQNGKEAELRPVLRDGKCGKHRRHRKKSKRHGAAPRALRRPAR